MEFGPLDRKNAVRVHPKERVVKDRFTGKTVVHVQMESFSGKPY